MTGVNLLKVAYAILDKKGRIVFDDPGALIYKTKKEADSWVEIEDGETVKKISIIAAQ